MPNNKNQHFVPQFYIKNFASGRRHVSIFLHDSGELIENASVKNLASDEYFYGKDSAHDEMLSQIEAASGPIIRKIIDNLELPDANSESFAHLLQFVITLRFRTSRAVDEHNDRFEESVKRDLLLNTELEQDDLDLLRVTDKNASNVVVQNAILGAAVAFDLKLKVLVNETPVPFLASDHPAVLYNQFLENRRPNVNNVGLVTKGLQIFCPISSQKCLMFYDRGTYRVGEVGNTVRIVDRNDVEQINNLQIVSSESLLIVPDEYDHASLISYIDRHSGLRSSGRLPFKVETVRANERELVELKSMPDYRVGLRLSFVTLLLSAIRYRIPSGIVVPRNTEALERHRMVLKQSEEFLAAAIERDRDERGTQSITE